MLIVEDDAAARVGLEQLVKSWGFIAESACDGEEALEKVTTFRPAIVITDLVMPRMDGLALLRALQQQGADVTTLLLTAQGTVETAVEAMKEGAYDYLTKPVDIQRLKILLDKIVERLETLREVKALRRQLREHGDVRIAHRQQPRDAEDLSGDRAGGADRARPCSSPASRGPARSSSRRRSISSARARRSRSSAINCAAIPETLLESEIFGHEKGAFTGAADRRQGCFELADRGTLFLDEIGEMTPATQVKLLRVLQERTFRRLGGRTEQSVDVRVIAATNIDPVEAVQTGQAARGSLLPPERLRVPPAAAARAQGRSAAPRPGVHQRVQHAQPEVDCRASISRRCACSSSYPWPGNVRELRNVIERATILAPGPVHRGEAPAAGADRRAAGAEHQPQVALGAGHDGRGGRAPADHDDARSTRATTRRAPPKSSASA